MSAPMYVPAFFVKQKFAMTTNRYEVMAANPDGALGQLMAVAQQKRLAFKEEVTFYSDESKSRPVFASRRAARSTSTPATTSPTSTASSSGSSARTSARA